MNKIFITMAIISIAINSFSLTFSKNYIVTRTNFIENSDTLTLYNNSEETITIDTIFEEMKINGQKLNDYAEFSFNIIETNLLNYYHDFQTINDTVFFAFREFNNNNKISIKANDSIILYNFILGKCIWCTNTQQTKISFNDTFDITIRFKYQNTMSDSVVFHGPTSNFFAESILRKSPKVVNKTDQNIHYDLLGRIYDKNVFKNKLRIISVIPEKRNTIFSDKKSK